MKYEETEKKVISIVAKVKEIDAAEISPDMDLLDALGLTSFDAFMLVAALEDGFGIEIEEELIREMITVEDIVRIVEKLSEENGEHK